MYIRNDFGIASYSTFLNHKRYQIYLTVRVGMAIEVRLTNVAKRLLFSSTR